MRAIRYISEVFLWLLLFTAIALIVLGLPTL